MMLLKQRRKYIILIISVILFIVLTFTTSAVLGLGHYNTEQFKGIKIYLSPSNQDKNFYAYGDTNEMQQCDIIAQKTAEMLKSRGFTVMVSKSGANMQEKCSESDIFGADLHIPIHTNALNGEYTGGTRAYVYDESNCSAAEYLLDSVGKISPGRDDAMECMPDLYEVNKPAATTLYLECEFHDTEEGAKWIVNNTSRIANAICDGICDYYSNL